MTFCSYQIMTQLNSSCANWYMTYIFGPMILLVCKANCIFFRVHTLWDLHGRFLTCILGFYVVENFNLNGQSSISELVFKNLK